MLPIADCFKLGLQSGTGKSKPNGDPLELAAEIIKRISFQPKWCIVLEEIHNNITWGVLPPSPTSWTVKDEIYIGHLTVTVINTAEYYTWFR